jgi:hypothetical protein
MRISSRERKRKQCDYVVLRTLAIAFEHRRYGPTGHGHKEKSMTDVVAMWRVASLSRHRRRGIPRNGVGDEVSQRHGGGREREITKGIEILRSVCLETSLRRRRRPRLPMWKRRTLEARLLAPWSPRGSSRWNFHPLKLRKACVAKVLAMGRERQVSSSMGQVEARDGLPGFSGGTGGVCRGGLRHGDLKDPG